MPKRDPTSDLAAFWCLRVLLSGDMRRHLSGRHGNGIDYRIMHTIGLSELQHEGDSRKIILRAKARQRDVERAHCFGQAPVLRTVGRLARRLGLDDVDRDVLGVAALCAVDEGLKTCFERQATRVTALAAATGRSRRDVRRALAPESLLHGGGLLSNRGGEFCVPDEVAEPLVDGVFSIVPITRRAARRWKASSLSLGDFEHLANDVSLARDLLRGALARRTRGVHILVYGPPGTGKTELARVLTSEACQHPFAPGIAMNQASSVSGVFAASVRS
jgi:hypothetical protein